MTSSVFYRDLHKDYLRIVGGSGMYLKDASGRQILDAVGGAGAVVLGHGVRDITDAIAAHGAELSFVYSATFTNPWQEELASELIKLAPPSMDRVYFVSGGSEANETAVKMARQYHVQRGNSSKHKVIARWQSFHGSTLATLSLSGRPAWRAPFLPQLQAVPHIAPPYCYRCPIGSTYPDCAVACADELERTILMEGPESVAAFIAEPIIGTTATGVVPVPEYYPRIREICDRYDVLFIADEVLTGYWRTGPFLAIEHWNVEPDIITMGKGISSGYVPLGAVLASKRVVQAFDEGSGQFSHGFTYSGNPMCTFVGLEVLRYVQQHRLADQVTQKGELLDCALRQVAARHQMLGDIRGRGLLVGLEFVADPKSRQPFEEDLAVTQRIVRTALEKGVLVIPGVPGINYGKGGDHIQITPPYIIEQHDVDRIAQVLDETLTEVEAAVAA